MQIIGGAAQDINVLQTATGNIRNEDFVSTAGLSYFDSMQVNAVAAEYSRTQLLNAAASGVQVYVDEIWIKTATAISVGISELDVALASDAGAWGNVKLGAAVGESHTVYDTTAGLTGTTRISIPLDAYQTLIYKPKYPIVLDEGKGVSAFAFTVNSTIWVNYFGSEIGV